MAVWSKALPLTASCLSQVYGLMNEYQVNTPIVLSPIYTSRNFAGNVLATIGDGGQLVS